MTQAMTIHTAAAFTVPTGKHRYRTLAAVALDDPAHLEWLLGPGSPECPEGSAYREAVETIVAQLRRNAEADILAGRTIDPGALKAVVAEAGPGRDVGRPRGRGRKAAEGGPTAGLLFAPDDGDDQHAAGAGAIAGAGAGEVER